MLELTTYAVEADEGSTERKTLEEMTPDQIAVYQARIQEMIGAMDEVARRGSRAGEPEARAKGTR